MSGSNLFRACIREISKSSSNHIESSGFWESPVVSLYTPTQDQLISAMWNTTQPCSIGDSALEQNKRLRDPWTLMITYPNTVSWMIQSDIIVIGSVFMCRYVFEYNVQKHCINKITSKKSLIHEKMIILLARKTLRHYFFKDPHARIKCRVITGNILYEMHFYIFTISPAYRFIGEVWERVNVHFMLGLDHNWSNFNVTVNGTGITWRFFS